MKNYSDTNGIVYTYCLVFRCSPLFGITDMETKGIVFSWRENEIGILLTGFWLI